MLGRREPFWFTIEVSNVLSAPTVTLSLSDSNVFVSALNVRVNLIGSIVLYPGSVFVSVMVYSPTPKPLNVTVPSV